VVVAEANTVVVAGPDITAVEANTTAAVTLKPLRSCERLSWH
jgi:hypothetical protein